MSSSNNENSGSGSGQDNSSSNAGSGSNTNCGIIKDGWDDRSNFQASHGLSMTPEGISEGNQILDAMRKSDNSASSWAGRSKRPLEVLVKGKWRRAWQTASRNSDQPVRG